MFYILTENRTVIPYESSKSIHRINKVSSIRAIEGHQTEAVLPDSKNSKDFQSKQQRLPKFYEDQIEDSAPAHPLIVESIMTKNPKSLSEKDSIEEAKTIFEATHYRHFPILSISGNLVGMISDRDLLKGSSGTISEIMSKSIITVSPKASIRELALIMLDEKLSCLPVVAEDHSLIGIVTTTDILKTFITHTSAEVWR